MSTQYWLYPERVIENAMCAYDPTFFVIQRPRNEQLVSYLSHLRRGHIDDRDIGCLYKHDAEFATYLDRMSRWNETYHSLKKQYSNLRFIDIRFDDLISDPAAVVRRIVPGAIVGENFDPGIAKNPASYPRFGILNRIFLSNIVRSVGRVLPQRLYSRLIRIRKSVVGANLKAGRGKHFEGDRDFVNRMYQ